MPGRRDLWLSDRPRTNPAPQPRTRPASPDHPQRDRLTERREINQIDLAAVLHPRHRRAAATRWPDLTGLDHHDQFAWFGLVDTDNVDIGQPDQQFAHARRIQFHRDSLESVGSATSILGVPVSSLADPGYLTPRSNPKSPITSKTAWGRSRRGVICEHARLGFSDRCSGES